MKKWLSNLFRMTQYAEGDANAQSQAEPSSNPPAAEPPSGGLSGYIGSKEVNPEQRPLKDFDRSMYRSEKEIDEFIKMAGEKVFMPKDEKKEPVKEPEKKEIEKKEIEKKVPSKEPEKKEPEEDAFFKFYGWGKEEFLKLPEEVQNRLADTYERVTSENSEFTSLNERYTQLLTDVEQLNNDPVIAARLEELETNQKYVADSLPAFDESDVQALIDTHGSTVAEFTKALNAAVSKAAAEVIKIERGVFDRKVSVEKAKADATKVISDIIAKEPRLGIKEKDLAKFVKLGNKHAEYDKLYGAGSLMEMVKNKGYTPQQIVAKGADELLLEYAKTKGWDKERDTNIAKNSVRKLLDNIRKAASEAASITNAPKNPNSTGNTPEPTAFDQASLIKEISDGNTATWRRLLKAADAAGDHKMVSRLTSIFDIGMRNQR